MSDDKIIDDWYKDDSNSSQRGRLSQILADLAYVGVQPGSDGHKYSDIKRFLPGAKFQIFLELIEAVPYDESIYRCTINGSYDLPVLDVKTGFWLLQESQKAGDDLFHDFSYKYKEFPFYIYQYSMVRDVSFITKKHPDGIFERVFSGTVVQGLNSLPQYVGRYFNPQGRLNGYDPGRPFTWRDGDSPEHNIGKKDVLTFSDVEIGKMSLPTANDRT